MSAHDILRNSAHSIVEKCILVCIWFSKCGSVILWSEFAFLFPLTQDPSFSNRKAGVPTYPGKLVPGLYNTYIHTCMHACMHAYISTYVRTYVRTYILACMHACMHTYLPTDRQTGRQAGRQTDRHTYIHTYIHHARMHACMHASIHPSIHTYIALHCIALHCITLHYITLHTYISKVGLHSHIAGCTSIHSYGSSTVVNIPIVYTESHKNKLG